MFSNLCGAGILPVNSIHPYLILPYLSKDKLLK